MTTYPVEHLILEIASAELSKRSFVVAERLLDGLEQPVLVVESPELVAVVLAAKRWTEAAETVESSQVALANWSSRTDRSSRRWDLYVVVLLESLPADADEGAAIEIAEASTELTRKIVRSGVSADSNGVRSALRPLLPLVPLGRTALPSLAGALSERLRMHGVDATLAETVVQDFMSTGKVWVR